MSSRGTTSTTQRPTTSSFSRSGARPRLALLTWTYSDARGYLSRLLERLEGVQHTQSVNSQLTRLRESGRVVVVAVSGWAVGLMRPLLLGDRALIDAEDPPFLICAEPTTGGGLPALPILAPDRDRAVALIRRLEDEASIDKQLWRAYEYERQKTELEKLVLRITGADVAVSKTELAWGIDSGRKKPREIVVSRGRAKVTTPRR